MRKYIITLSAVMAMLMTLPSCGDKKPESSAVDQAALAAASREELTQAINERDELLDLVNSINGDMMQLKEMEGILSAPSLSSETPSRRQQFSDDIAAIRKSIEDRKEQLSNLEEKLKKSNLTNSNLLKTIESLRTQISQQETLIATLKSDLEKAGTKIAQLDEKVENLNTTVAEVTTQRDEVTKQRDEVTEQRDQAEKEAAQREKELNTVHYVFASKSELKSHNILTGGGFLRSAKLNPAEYGSSFFTAADKRTLTHINLMSDKAKVLTSQPRSSYTLDKVNGQYVLTITNKESFWRIPYLVIQVD